MYERRNNYLKRREERNRMRQERDYQDYRSREPRDYRDYMDYRGSMDFRSRGSRDSRDYRDYRDYRGSRDYESYRDGSGYDYADSEYKADLKNWIEKLKSKDRFGVSKQQVIEQAKNMGVQFSEYTEEEFYAIYLAMVSDYKTLSNDYNIYIKIAKEFLEDDDIAVSPSEKVCIYLYQIVLGEE